MTEVKVKDEGGDTLTMIDFGDFRSSLFGRTIEYIRDVNKHLNDFQFKDDDVLLCSYPKAGCTWTYEILTMLMKGKPEGPAESKMFSMIEATSADDINKIPSPRLLNTHLPYRRIPADINNKTVKIVFVVRNPKDVAVSLYSMLYAFKHYNYSGTFSNWLPLFLRGDLAYDRYLRYLKDWEDVLKANKHNMLVLYFEELKKDTLTGVRKLAEFLGVHHSDELLQEISDKCQFQHMKERYSKSMLGPSLYKPEVKYGFMRKGQVGNWKDWFTVAQSEEVDRMVSEEMKDSNFKFIYQL
ncbi:amine sulfotransferase-like [Ruditapes philippinarum]|uniref:amine sulfotransferase-like n=1 Tax=Ruditapes philippinarum TaxID=129788 RepID=UPI00295BD217|nr:amine sulfotransferase-like [Ruditapes philippinarum]XP_060570396.1 amine sulfotransferase-like [Ruditapes philippinarum]